MSSILILTCAGFLAAAMNALGGGGSFLSLPAMIFTGISPVTANASSTVALYPAGLASVWGYRKGFVPVGLLPTWILVAVTIVGGIVGALLLLHTSSGNFEVLLPWLLLCATLTLWFAPKIANSTRFSFQPGPWMSGVIQFGLGIYGGYYGGAMGLLMMAVWSLLGHADLKRVQAARTLLVSAANTMAVVIFIVAGAVQWQACFYMMAGAIAGSIVGTRIGRSVSSRVVRAITLSIAIGMTILFFVKTYGHI